MRRTAELERELLELERREEFLIEAALADGVEVQRRFDASPYALLGLISPLDPRQQAVEEQQLEVAEAAE